MELCCRLCLNKNQNELRNVFEDFLLPQKINECVKINITVNDEIPKTVCTTCTTKINEWYKFKENCEFFNTILYRRLERLKNPPKEVELDPERTTGNVYNCTACPQEFDNLAEYLDHQDDHNGEPVFKCDYCPEMYSYKEDLRLHEITHKEKCLKCSQDILKTDLQAHLNNHPDDQQRQQVSFGCLECAHIFKTFADFDEHSAGCHKKRKNHICDTCGKQFSTKSGLTVHQRSHSDVRSYKCDRCDYAGRTASTLYRHKLIHLKQPEICPICSKVFQNFRYLNDHTRRVHCKFKNHECPYCDKRFVDKYMLTVHLRSHTGVKPFSCELCKKTFVRSDTLKEHLLTHQNQQFECDDCKKRFASKRSLRRHRCNKK